MRNNVLIFLAFLALFSSFLANERPLLCSTAGKLHYPIISKSIKGFGFAEHQTLDSIALYDLWKTYDYDWAVFTPVPYGPKEADRQNKKKSPFDSQTVKSIRYRHWLGTDKDGKDVLAGLISGTRVAFWVCATVLGIAASIGIFFGLIAGYYGDKRLKIGRFSAICLFLFAFPAVFYGKVVFAVSHLVLLAIGFFVSVMSFAFFAGKWIDRLFPTKKITVPLDLLLMRTAEVFNAVPGLIILGVAISVTDRLPSLWWLMALIGFFSWPNIALFIRGEMLRIRDLPYMESAKLLQLPDWKIMLQHALPNALPPAMIALSMGVGSAILLEASLSYLGFSSDLETVSWGQLLLGARSDWKAWWLTLFPGFMIFLVVSIFYSIAFEKQRK